MCSCHLSSGRWYELARAKLPTAAFHFNCFMQTSATRRTRQPSLICISPNLLAVYGNIFQQQPASAPSHSPLPSPTHALPLPASLEQLPQEQ